MTKPLWAIFYYNCKKHKSDFISVLAKQHRESNLTENVFQSSDFCQPLFEANFIITPEAGLTLPLAIVAICY